MAKIGAGGRHLSNSRRDLAVHSRRQYLFCKLMPIYYAVVRAMKSTQYDVFDEPVIPRFFEYKFF